MMAAQLSKVQGVGADFACLGDHHSFCIISLLHPGGFFDANLNILNDSWYDSWMPRGRGTEETKRGTSEEKYPLPYLRASIEQRL